MNALVQGRVSAIGFPLLPDLSQPIWIVEVEVAAGLPAWTIVGLASSAVQEVRERVSVALTNSGFTLPSRRVTFNLSPDCMASELTVGLMSPLLSHRAIRG